MRIAILGPGRLGRTLALLLPGAGHAVRLLSRHDPISAAGDADVALLTVPDHAIARVAAALPRGPIVLHCSGAADVDVLRPHRPAGSLHPLMTFPGPEVAVPALDGVPAALAGDPEAIEAGRRLALDLGMAPLEISGDRRLYHAAAVMAGNFATVLLADAARTLTAAGVPSDRAASALLPLALASLRNAAPDPVAALTGPAARGDHATVQGHRDALDAHGLFEVRGAYDALTARALALSRREHALPGPWSEPVEDDAAPPGAATDPSVAPLRGGSTGVDN